MTCATTRPRRTRELPMTRRPPLRSPAPPRARRDQPGQHARGADHQRGDRRHAQQPAVEVYRDRNDERGDSSRIR